MSVNTQVQVFDQLFHSAAAGLALVDEVGLLAEVNPAFAEAIGSSVDEMRGRKASSLLPRGSVTGQSTLPSEWQFSGNDRKARITSRALEGGGLVLTATPDSREEADHRLLGLQESLSLAMQGGRLGIWTRDLRTGKVEWSPELEMIFGLEPGTFGRNEAAFFEYVHPEDRDKVAGAVEWAFQSGQDYSVEFRIVRLDGTEGWMEGRGRVVSDATGKPLLLAGVGIDITERKQSELELRALNEAAMMLGSSLDIWVIYDRLQTLVAGIMDCENMIVSAFDAATETVTCSYAWMEGGRADVSKFPAMQLAPEGRGMQSTVIRTGEPLLLNDLLDARKRSTNSVIIDPDGTVRDQPLKELPITQSAIMVPIKLEGQVVGVVQVMSFRLGAYGEDQVRLLEGMVSQMAVAVQNARLYEEAQREIEQRRKLEEELEMRVVERTAELAGFTYTVSHDLRAPLRAMNSASRILLEDYGTGFDEGARKELERLAAAANKMGLLIDALLQYSRLGRAELARRPVNLSGLVSEVAEGVRSRYTEGIEVQVEEGLMAEGDSLLLGLALENLIDNAFKYGGRRLVFGRAPEGFFLEDNGIGFEPQYAEKIFEPFQRLVLEREYPGTGIGLANVKRIIEKHGGRVWAEGRPGDGATFWFLLS